MKWPKFHIKLTKKHLFWGSLIILTSVLVCDWGIQEFAQKNMYDDITELPHNHVGLVLGTSKYTSNGGVNYYFKYRIDAAAELYNQRKIDYILVSGDNGQMSYNEPKMMLEALLAKGIPRDKIILDYAGFRTYDSMVRCKEVFGQSQVTVISQKFHNERALFIAQQKDLDAIAFNARDVNPKDSIGVSLREKLARVVAVFDVFTNKQPKYLGEKVEIPS